MVNKTQGLPRKRAAMQYGKGHGGISDLPAIVEITHTSRARAMHSSFPPHFRAAVRTYLLGRCLITVTPPMATDGWILSIDHPDRYPTWDEIAKARYELMPADALVGMMLPPKEQFINIAGNNFLLGELPSLNLMQQVYEAEMTARMALIDAHNAAVTSAASGAPSLHPFRMGYCEGMAAALALLEQHLMSQPVTAAEGEGAT